MIIGRENTSKELSDQEYLSTKIQPCLSSMTIELLKTKPAEPIPAMIGFFNKIALEQDIKQKM